MMTKRIGTQTIKFQSPPSIISRASIVGPKEGQGPLKDYFDEILTDDYVGEKSWELAESKIFEKAVDLALKKVNLKPSDINYLFGGDLLNQIISSSFAARSMQIPFFGLYGACSTMAEALSLAAMMIDGGFADYTIAATSSHFSSAERQFRYPLELGNQRTPTSQWTVTGAGATILSKYGNGPYITYVTTGKVVDLGIKDANNMGAAMAPAAADTIINHFRDTGFSPTDYDLVVTGDLGRVGSDLLYEILAREGFDIKDIHMDCGLEIFDESQDIQAGGSGCGCSAVVLNGYLLSEMSKGLFNRIFFMATGALLSTTSTQQGESIPCIAHGVVIERFLN